MPSRPRCQAGWERAGRSSGKAGRRACPPRVTCTREWRVRRWAPTGRKACAGGMQTLALGGPPSEGGRGSTGEGEAASRQLGERAETGLGSKGDGGGVQPRGPFGQLNLRVPFNPEGLGLMVVLNLRETPRCRRTQLATLPPDREACGPTTPQLHLGLRDRRGAWSPPPSAVTASSSKPAYGTLARQDGPSARGLPPPAGRLGGWAAGGHTGTGAPCLPENSALGHQTSRGKNRTLFSKFPLT